MLSSILDNMYWKSALLTVMVWLGVHFLYHTRMRKLVNKLPGPPGLPVIGNVLDFMIPHSELVELGRKYSLLYSRDGVTKFWLGHRAFVGLTKASGCEALLGSATQIKKSVEYDFLHPWLGTGLLTSSGNKWHSRRKLLTSAFHFRILEEFIAIFNEQSEILVQQLADKVGQPAFDIFPLLGYCTLDIICETAMSRHMHAQKNMESPYVQAVRKMTDIIHSRQMSPWLWPDWLFALTEEGRTHKRCLKILHSFTEKVIRERKEEFNAQEKNTCVEDDGIIGKKKRLAFLDLLLQVSDNGRVLSDLDIREEVDTFMFEGHDTTASSLTFVLFLLGTHPEIQEQVQEEIDSVLGDSERRVTSDDLKELKYLECCIKEALRLFPPVPLMGRHLSEDISVEGHVIPAGVTLFIGPYTLHRDPEQFQNPEMFDPERFRPENSRERHPFAYVPFSAGQRNCIGQKFALMEEKVILVHLLRKYSIEVVDKVKPEKLKLLGEVVLRPLNGLPVNLKLREKQAVR